MGEQEPLIGMVKPRHGRVFFNNPSEWKFSLFNIFYIFRHISDYLKYFFRHRASKPNSVDLKKHLPEVDRSHLDILLTKPSNGVRVLWIGHASLLIQIDGINILTDPVFHDCGPTYFGYRYFNYKRYRPPAVTVSDLREKYNIRIDVILISHDHFDHLDEESVSELVAAYGTGIEWFVPKNMNHWFASMGCTKVIDLDWWEERSNSSQLTVACTPAKHWSGRSLQYYYCRHLWCSWYIRGPHDSTFFFAGDTGYVPDLYRVIKDKYGAPDVAAIPIGACEPRSVMKAQHINPEEAMKIHREIKARNSIGIHWGMFALSNEKIDEPKEALKKAKKEDSDETFITMDHGEVRMFLKDEDD